LRRQILRVVAIGMYYFIIKTNNNSSIESSILCYCLVQYEPANSK